MFAPRFSRPYNDATMFRRNENAPGREFNPDDFRMTVGEHLEDLRKRLILALVGFVLAAVVCLFLGKDLIIPWFCKPLTDTLTKYGLPTQLHSDEIPVIAINVEPDFITLYPTRIRGHIPIKAYYIGGTTAHRKVM